MKKTLIAGLTGLLAAATFAGVNNVVVTFGTKGPDTYADGQTVVDGETYALVWTPSGSEFAGFNADGSAVAPSKVALKAPIAEDGRCPNVVFEIDGTFVDANYGDGTWGVYLLDTRVFAKASADAAATATGEVGGSSVHGYGLLGATSGQFVSASTATASAGVLPADKQDVKITGIKVVDGYVYISVSGTSSAATYALNAGDTPNATQEAETQAGNTAGDMIIVRPAKAGGEFFSVNRK